jgi:hypothetical protein
MRIPYTISAFLLFFHLSWAETKSEETSNNREPDRFQTVDIKDSKTKIPATRIRLNVAPLNRTDYGYSSTYAVKVFPFFFFNEHGSIEINLDKDCIQRIVAGETVSFAGSAVNHRGSKRKITGEAAPGDSESGDIQIIIKASGLDLTFNTSYLLTGDSQS